jgi:TPP-dependent pyruvate/acetoin dehydrogenase alpha subunit
VAVAFFGDGAVNEGAFHEAMNLAAVWKLPVLFVCENNVYGFSTHYRRVMVREDIADRAAGYGMPGLVVDGMDAAAVYAAAGKAIEKARAGGGPTLLECKTYRFMGHSRFEPSSYRTREELDQWKKRDPIALLAGRLRGLGVAEAELAAVDEEAVALMDEAVRFAEASPDPAPDDWKRYIHA